MTLVPLILTLVPFKMSLAASEGFNGCKNSVTKDQCDNKTTDVLSVCASLCVLQ